MHVQPVEVGRGADPVDVALARISDMGVVAHGLRPAVDQHARPGIGLGVLEHQRTKIHVGILHVVGIPFAVAVERQRAVERSEALRITRIVVHLGIVDAPDPLGKAVDDAHAAFEAQPHVRGADPAPPGADVEHAVGGRRSELRLVGDVGQQRHGFDLFGIELQLGDVDRNVVDDILNGLAAGIKQHGRLVRGDGNARCAALFHHLQSGNESRQLVADVGAGVFPDCAAPDRTGAARAFIDRNSAVHGKVDDAVRCGAGGLRSRAPGNRGRHTACQNSGQHPDSVFFHSKFCLG